MQTNELALLLTVARILRARLPELAPSYQEDDLRALNAGLAPFEAKQAEPINEESHRPRPPKRKPAED